MAVYVWELFQLSVVVPLALCGHLQIASEVFYLTKAESRQHLQWKILVRSALNRSLCRDAPPDVPPQIQEVENV